MAKQTATITGKELSAALRVGFYMQQPDGLKEMVEAIEDSGRQVSENIKQFLANNPSHGRAWQRLQDQRGRQKRRWAVDTGTRLTKKTQQIAGHAFQAEDPRHKVYELGKWLGRRYVSAGTRPEPFRSFEEQCVEMVRRIDQDILERTTSLKLLASTRSTKRQGGLERIITSALRKYRGEVRLSDAQRIWLIFEAFCGDLERATYKKRSLPSAADGGMGTVPPQSRSGPADASRARKRASSRRQTRSSGAAASTKSGSRRRPTRSDESTATSGGRKTKEDEPRKRSPRGAWAHKVEPPVIGKWLRPPIKAATLKSLAKICAMSEKTLRKANKDEDVYVMWTTGGPWYVYFKNQTQFDEADERV